MIKEKVNNTERIVSCLMTSVFSISTIYITNMILFDSIHCYPFKDKMQMLCTVDGDSLSISANEQTMESSYSIDHQFNNDK